MKLIAYIFQYSPFLTAAKLLTSFISAISTPLIIFITQNLVDTFLNGHGRTILPDTWGWLLALLFCMLFAASGNRLDGWLTIHLKRKLTYSITDKVIEKFQTLDYSCLETEETYHVISRLGKHPEETILNTFLELVNTARYLIAVLGNVIVFFQIGILPVIVYLLLLIPIFALEYQCCKIMADSFKNQTPDEIWMNYYKSLFSEKSSVFELRSFRAVSYIFERWKKTSRDVMNYRIRTTIKSQKYLLFSSIIYIIWSAYLIYTLITETSSGAVSFGICTALIATIASLVKNVEDFIWSFEGLSEKLIYVSYLDDFFQLKDVPAYGKKQIPEQRMEICFDHVTFTYPGAANPVLRDVCFTISSDSHTALVGMNGAGKSTIIKLLCRLYQPDSGTITINGINLNEIHVDVLKNLFSVVFQDYGSYKLSLRENVAFGNLQKFHDDQPLIQALENTGFPMEKIQLDTQYGKLEENSTELSGGEWQKVALARAYVSNSRYFILDEPTAAMDPMAESALYTTFLSLMKKKGSLIISHRLASAVIADQILVLADGCICEQGTHDVLLEKNGLYAQMWNAQSAYYKEANE